MFKGIAKKIKKLEDTINNIEKGYKAKKKEVNKTKSSK